MMKEYCTHCNGFGSSLKDPGDSRCWGCGGTGLKEDQDLLDEQAEQGAEEVRAERINDRVMSGYWGGQQ